MAKKKSAKSQSDQPEYSDPCEMDADRLEIVKQCEAALEDSRLMHEEAKAKYGLCRAELKLFVAKRNRIIAKTLVPADVEDAQREVDNARLRAVKAKALSDASKDHWKGSEEALAKSLTERLPLFDKKKAG